MKGGEKGKGLWEKLPLIRQKGGRFKGRSEQQEKGEKFSRKGRERCNSTVRADLGAEAKGILGRNPKEEKLRGRMGKKKKERGEIQVGNMGACWGKCSLKK